MFLKYSAAVLLFVRKSLTYTNNKTAANGKSPCELNIIEVFPFGTIILKGEEIAMPNLISSWQKMLFLNRLENIKAKEETANVVKMIKKNLLLQ